MSPYVKLSNSEMLWAVTEGSLRVLRKLQRGDKDKAGADLPRWQTDIEAAAAEIAVASLLDRFPCGLAASHVPDVSGDLQVRHTEQATGCLIIRPGDDPAHRYVLVRGHYGVYEVVGWQYGHVSRQDRWLRGPGERPDAWFVPEDGLQPMEEL